MQLVKRYNNMMKWGSRMEIDTKTFMYGCFSSYQNLKHLQKNSKHFSEDDYHDMQNIAKNIISLYLNYSNVTDFSSVIEHFKEQYINGESKIENNETKEEKEGIGIIYDYICNYDFEKSKFNIFVNSMDIHTKLYSRCVGHEFGGKIRTEQALLFDTDIEVIPPMEAMNRFNSYIGKSDMIMKNLDEKDVFSYIEGCLKIMTDLIKIQPFADGNKRTFRSLFNLMMKRWNLPPVYIGDNSEEFSNALLKAMRTDDFSDLTNLYIRLICDSIVLLGLEEYQIENRKTI